MYGAFFREQILIHIRKAKKKVKNLNQIEQLLSLIAISLMITHHGDLQLSSSHFCLALWNSKGEIIWLKLYKIHEIEALLSMLTNNTHKSEGYKFIITL